MKRVEARIALYMLMGGALFASAQGLATFDPATGDFDLHAFNVYEAADNIAAILGSLGVVAFTFRRWGTR